MVNSENTMTIDMEIRSDKLRKDDPPDAELHIVYRRVEYDALLSIEEQFIANPLRSLIQEAKDKT